MARPLAGGHALGMEDNEPFRWPRAIAIVIGLAVASAIIGAILVTVVVMALGVNSSVIVLAQGVAYFAATLICGWIGGRLAQRAPLAHALAIAAPLGCIEALQFLLSGGRAPVARTIDLVALFGGAIVGGLIAAVFRGLAR